MSDHSAKTAIILHGTGSSPKENWFPWLESELVNMGLVVWTPQLPNTNKPNPQEVIPFITQNFPFQISENTILVGHSSGAVEILHLLPTLSTRIRLSILVGSFKDNEFLKYEANNELFSIPLDLESCQAHCQEFIYIHSDNDPFCPLDHAQYLMSKTGGSLIILPGQKHFSLSTMGASYSKFPKLLEIIKTKI